MKFKVFPLNLFLFLTNSIWLHRTALVKSSECKQSIEALASHFNHSGALDFLPLVYTFEDKPESKRGIYWPFLHAGSDVSGF